MIRGGEIEGGERKTERKKERIRGGYKFEGCVQTNISQCVRKCSLFIHFSETTEIRCGTGLGKNTIQHHLAMQSMTTFLVDNW